MSEVVDKLVAEGRLNEEQVERIGRQVRDFVKAAQEDPALFDEAQEKLSAGGMWGPVAKNLMLGGSLAAGSAMGMAGYNAVAGKLQGIKDDKMKAKHYKDMIDVSPELAESGVDATLMQRHFNTLYKFNPDYAKDPMVAASYVSSTMEAAKPSIGILNELVKARQSHVQAQQGARSIPQPAEQLMGHVSKGMGLLDRMKDQGGGGGGGGGGGHM